MPPRFVILHGWENRRPADHWEHWLFDELSARDLEVDYPQLPDPDEPDLDTWLGLLDALVSRGERDVTLVVHSLATSLWLTHLARGGSPGRVTRLALVAIPSPAVLTPTVVAPFVEHPRRIGALPGVEQIVFEGEGDEYSPGGVRADYAIDPTFTVEAVPGGGHLVPASGFGPWPRILEWTLGVRLGA
ncbi:RBBP9/YdeN family alpha/beta hydrolase [Pseudolysinimonas sp.]|jgi:predicted alpha/beta hydrolase family esterase|uniref:RBBP9/YdeN family alpha/beta hydrolase n=1 Tax=Pseudolysinimonas sp. TaxID=2680009 RepID=UPI003784994E